MERRDTKHHKQYAVLVGINWYCERPLKGCAYDINEIARYLQESCPGLQPRRLIATEPDVLSPSKKPASKSQWPTYENFTSQLEEVINVGQLGDNVNIHFSGHGTRMEPSTPFSNTAYGDLALVLLEEPPLIGVRYFRGSELAHHIHKMASKGLTVSVVLDCCFSGSMVRQSDDMGVRYIEYDPRVDEKYPQILAKSLYDDSGRSTHRTGSMLPNWLIDPNGYTILTACGPHETARELEVEGQRRGALSYFLCRTLNRLSNHWYRQQELYDHLCLRFKEHWPQQNPMFYGNPSLCLLGAARGATMSPLGITWRRQTNEVVLQAGRAHGVSDGDQLALYAFANAEHRRNAIVTHAGPLTSTVRVSDDAKTTSAVLSAWNARMVEQRCLLRFSVRLALEMTELREMLERTEDVPFRVHNHADDELQVLFYVSTNADELRIEDESRTRVQNLPLIAQTEYAHALEVLRHLVKYQQVKELVNRQTEAEFTSSVTVQLVDQANGYLEAGQIFSVDHNSSVRLKVQNKGPNSLYVHVYSLGPCWQIENMLRKSYEVLPPNDPLKGFSGCWNIDINLSVPEGLQEKGFCEGVVKVLVTSHPTSFRCFEMPKLTCPPRASLSDEQFRGDTIPIDEVAEGERGSVEAWVAFDFLLRTTVP